MARMSTQHTIQSERPVLAAEPKETLPGGNLRWIVALALFGVIAVGTYAVGIG